MSENECLPFIIILCDFDGEWLLPGMEGETGLCMEATEECLVGKTALL